MRQLATIQTIASIDEIPGADAIEVASVKGWKVVVKKGEFSVGDKVVYLEIDSWVPNPIAPFLSKGEPREYEGIKGERLRTVKLRGQISQGLVLPLSIVPQSYGLDFSRPDGEDLSELLNINKWEAPIADNLRGQIAGNFPGFLRKTDEERIQNLTNLLPNLLGITFNLHEKLDGSSCTVYRDNEGEFGVCSRNLAIKESDDNSFWRVAKKYDLPNKLPVNICVQGELVGPGVQKNKYGLKELDLYIFNVFDIHTGSYLDFEKAKELADELGLKWVPFVQDYTISDTTTVDELLLLAEGKSVLNTNTEREGLVWRPYQEQEMRGLGRLSFKTISNKFLLKNDD